MEEKITRMKFVTIAILIKFTEIIIGTGLLLERCKRQALKTDKKVPMGNYFDHGAHGLLIVIRN